MRKKFIFDGVSTSDYGIIISGDGVFPRAERDVSYVNIPGRDGALMYDNGRFHNVTVSYTCGIERDFAQKFSAFCAALPPTGYHRLEDTYHPDEYRLAAMVGELAPERLGANWAAGEFEIKFDCKPQRFLKSGEIPVEFTVPSTLRNVWMDALPLVTVYGTGAGTVTIGGDTVTIKAIDGSVTLDCDTQNAYKGVANKNASIYAPTFPRLTRGDNVVSWTGGVSKVEIVPRWWTI